MKRHQAIGPKSLPLDLPDLGQRLGTLTPCLLNLGVWPHHYAGACELNSTSTRLTLRLVNPALGGTEGATDLISTCVLSADPM